MKNIAVFFALAIISMQPFISYAQVDSTFENYNKAYFDIKETLDSNLDFSFKLVSFLTEDVFFDNHLDYLKYNGSINQLKLMAIAWMKANPLNGYHYADSVNFLKNLAIYKVLKDTIRFVNNDSSQYAHLPYTYDFNDFFGQADWSNMFVTKLLATHRGNCHSLPYLYKILSDELGATCWLALAPNHAYISNRCRKIGWYNTELTSGEFPIDAWIMASGYIPVEAIQSGIYMDTLSNQQSIALCALDLAKGYEHKTRNYYDGFIIKCCDLSLQYFPKNVQAMLLKAEALKRIYERQAKLKDTARKATYKEMERLYAKLFSFGYREMPEKMYMDWLQSVIRERDKYSNKLVGREVQRTK